MRFTYSAPFASNKGGITKPALELIGKAIAVNPATAAYHNNYAAALLSLERFAEAKASIHRALAIRPNYADALANLGMALVKLGEDDSAEASLRNALQIDPKHRDARKRLATLLADNGRAYEAVKLFAELAGAGMTADMAFNYGNLLFTLGRTEDAIAQYRHAIALKNDYVHAHFNLGGRSAKKSSMRRRAQANIFARAAELCPNKPLWRLRAALCAPVVFEDGKEIEEYCGRVEAGDCGSAAGRIFITLRRDVGRCSGRHTECACYLAAR